MTALVGAVAKHGVNILSQLNVGESFVKDLGIVFSDTEIVKAEYAEQHETSLIVFKAEEEEIDIGKAFSECDIEIVVQYVKDSSIPEANKYGGNLFSGAAMQNTPKYTKMMIALIQAGYDIARADGEGITTYDRLKSLEPANGVALCLLGANADISDEINAIGEDGMNDVHRAIQAGQEQTLSILLASGGDPNIPISDGILPIILAMQSKLNMSEMFYVLVKNGADISGFDIEAVEGLESLGTVIDPKTTKYIAAARDSSLSVKLYT